MPTTPSVFKFSDPIEYLRFRAEERRRRDPRFTISSWARRLGYENPSFLSQVLKRERTLKMNLVEKLGADLELKGRALRYFECLALGSASRSTSEKRMYQGLARQARPVKFRNLEDLSPEAFASVADWFYAALTECIHLADFREDAGFLRDRFGGRLTKKQIRAAIAKLLETGRLSRDARGHLQRGSGNANDAVLMRSNLASEAIRSYHLQMLELARAAVREQGVHERYLRGTTIPLRREDYAKATAIVLEAHRQLLELAAPEGADEVYQLNTQLFRLSARPSCRTKLH